MSTAIALLLIAAAAAFVIAPFFARPEAGEPAGSEPRLDRRALEQRKIEAYAVIKETEFDYRMGKLSDADFTAIRDRYTAQALEALTALHASPNASAPQRAEAHQRARVAFCPRCGQSAPRRANFCPACGAALKDVAA